MSRSDWLKHPQVRLIGGLLVAVAFCSSWIGYGLLQSTKYEREARANTEEYARYTSDQIAEACITLPNQEKIECLHDASDAQREQSYNQQDLVAQRQSALWAYIMAAAAVIGMALSAVGVWLVWGTWKQTAQAAESARRTLGLFIAKERAFLRATNTINRSRRDEGSGFIVVFENLGESLAEIVSTHWSYVTEGTWPEEFGQSTFRNTPVAAGRGGTTEILSPGEFPCDPCWLVGSVSYITLEDKTFISYFCFRVLIVERERGQATQWDTEICDLAGMPRDT
jgi:hypothetical protein